MLIGDKEVTLLAIRDNNAVIIHGHSVKGIKQDVRCYENANETSSDLDVHERRYLELMSLPLRVI